MARPADVDRGEREDRRRRALAVPTRRRIFELIAAAPKPLGVAELARACAVHDNTVRLHLASLVDTGLVIQQTEERSHRGRPGYRYRAVESQPYRQLAAWLAEAVRTRSDTRETGRRIGRREALRIGGAEPAGTMFDVFARQGFAPAWDAASGDGRVLILTECPFAAVAEADGVTICSLHLGIAEGVAEATGLLAVDGLEPNGLRRSGPCRLRLHATPSE